MKVLISTDTSCLINYEVLAKYPISVFNLNVIIDDKEYLDGITIKQDFLLQEMNANKIIKTSTPPLGMVIEYFENLFAKGYDKIIHFTISSKLSSMYSLFTTVSKNYFDDKVIVIDGYSVSSLMLSHVLFAYDELLKGTEPEVIKDLIEERKQLNSIVYFIPNNLTALKNGGRISPALAAIGNTIGLKPVILLKDGELVKDSMTRTTKKAFFEKINSLKETHPNSEFDYALVEFGGNEAIVNAIYEHTTNVLGVEPLKGLIPINVCAHCGPGTIGFLVTPKINGKSLKEFI